MPSIRKELGFWLGWSLIFPASRTLISVESASENSFVHSGVAGKNLFLSKKLACFKAEVRNLFSGKGLWILTTSSMGHI